MTSVKRSIICFNLSEAVTDRDILELAGNFFHCFGDIFYTCSMYLLVNFYSKLFVWSCRNICVIMNKISSPFLLTFNSLCT